MANVFISYERSSEPFARKVKAALTAAGHQAWSDEELPPHRAYAEVIQERLSDADAVVVLWSQAAAHSQWVRAEAEFARERDRLVQVTLDGGLPPMPFNQVQCARLQGWKGDAGAPEWRKVLQSIEGFGPLRAGEAPPASHIAQPSPTRGGRGAWIAAGLVLLAVVAGAWWTVEHFARHDPASRVAVLPFQTLSNNPDAKFFADGLSEQILTTLSNNKVEVVSHDDAESLRGSDRERQIKALGVALLFTGSVENDGSRITVRVHIDDPAHHTTLWAGGVEGPVADGAQLQKQIAHTAVNVVACSSRALRPSSGLRDPELLGRYLRACDLFTNQNDATGPQAMFEMLGDLRKVVAGAPNFAPAHSDLAKFDAYLAPLAPPDQAEVMRKESAREADLALRVDPISPDAYLAREMLLPATDWAKREELLRQGIAVDPQWPHTNGFLAKLLMEMGRVQDAQAYAARAAAADLQIDWRPMAADLSCGAGRFDENIAFLKAQMIERPKSGQVRATLASCLVQQGRFEDARAAVAQGQPAGAQAWKAEVDWWKAAVDRTPTNLAEARRGLLPVMQTRYQGPRRTIEGLTQLGFLDDAFEVLGRYTPTGPTTGGEGAFLFYPQMAPLRRDPRFMQYAGRVGLAAYWKSSGKWPDYCAAPDLPYNCRTEAERWIKR